MTLPIILRNVTHSVAGSSKYDGDLILTSDAIYYFPHTDVVNRRFLVISITLLILLSPLLAVLSGFVLWVFASLFLVLLIVAGVPLAGLVQEMFTSAIAKAFELVTESREADYDSSGPNIEQQPSDIVGPSSAEKLYPIILFPKLWYSLILDCALLTLKDNTSVSRHTLPFPTRLSKGNIRHISFSDSGSLIVSAEYDMENEFYIGKSRTDTLRTVLTEGAFVF